MNLTNAEKWRRYDKSYASFGHWILRSMHKVNHYFICYAEFPGAGKVRLDVALRYETCGIALALEI